MTPPATNRQVRVTAFPEGKLTEACFELVEAEVPAPREGEVLCRTTHLSIEPSNRARLQRTKVYRSISPAYQTALAPGDVMAGRVLARVEASRAEGLLPGDLVVAQYGWQEWAAVPADAVELVPPHEPATHHLSVLGVTGLTAYFGLLDVGRPRPGETVLVSAAGGAVGSVAGQLARISGCRVVGTAGSDDKCRWLVEELGYHAAVNHRRPDLAGALRDACPEGVDVMFDNTGGEVLAAALFRMNQRGRIVCCGAVSLLDGAGPAPGPRGIPGLVVTKRLRLEGFVVHDYPADAKELAVSRLARWVREGSLKAPEDIVVGLDAAPAALVDLLDGGNYGKRIVQL